MQFRIFSRKKYIVRFEMFGGILLSKLFWNQKIVRWSKIQKTKKWCFGNRSRPMKWARETLISQWYLFICFLSAFYVASSRITTVLVLLQFHCRWEKSSCKNWRIYMVTNTWRNVSTNVSTLSAKNTLIFDIFVQSSQISRLEHAKIV